MLDPAAIAFIAAIFMVGLFVFFAILWTGHKGHHFNVEYYQVRFLAIENKLRKENSTSFALVVIEADKLLDRALTEAGVPGNTLGERLKKNPNKFSDINAVWNAHKLRNYIAHEPDADISYTQAKNAIDSFKQALKDLGAI